MLSQLRINNFAIVHQFNLELEQGMSVITGETGAGKSIAIDALGLCLGQRTEVSMIRQGQSRADVSATFLLKENLNAKQWLADHELDDNDTPDECILRRTINLDGRSKAFINNQPVTVTQLRELGQLLVNISGQHASQQLLKTDYQLNLLDHYCHNQTLVEELQQQFRQWKKVTAELEAFRQTCANNEAKKQLLQYQVQELDEFNFQVGEFQELEETQRRLANSEALTTGAQAVLQLLNDNEMANIDSMLNKTCQYIADLTELDHRYAEIHELIEAALINVQEAVNSVEHLVDKIEQDPALLAETEQRIRQAMQLAKKHQITPDELPQYHQQLRRELAGLASFSQGEESLLAAEKQIADNLAHLAQQLSNKRQQGAITLAKSITEHIKLLAMENAEFSIQISSNNQQISSSGIDQVQFMLRSNLGQESQSLTKTASGGELSRIALVLQVLTSGKQSIPTLIFDEIDVGISGATANIVGKLLRKLGEQCQVLCVTHLPQVASHGHQHYMVEKYSKDNQTETKMKCLSNAERVKELARLLGGSKITQNTLANAQEMLELAV
ncbi:DNA repair protein RecN [Mergibacter septicus]|uniref:DNA repair protein RecN n=1 Tax=Mergibacter septicus TaxID=221402 RepID=UPI001179812B|nr:DNA repair protein RecN [Mergibacter septicus]AWX14499.1 DNA repair protein RecN [Mergibacter septicus]